jgi:hypothetical protein
MASAVNRRASSHFQASGELVLLWTACIRGCVQLLLFATTVQPLQEQSSSSTEVLCLEDLGLLDALPLADQLEGVSLNVLEQDALEGQSSVGARPRVVLLSVMPVCLISSTSSSSSSLSSPSSSSSSSASTFVPPSTITIEVQAPQAMAVRILILGQHEEVVVDNELHVQPGAQELRWVLGVYVM